MNTEQGHLKALSSISSLVAVGLWTAILPTDAQVNVTQYHNNSTRDGLYIDSAFTQSAAANLTRDLNFDGTIVGDVYAQPLYIEGGPNGPMIIAVTESNNVYALDAVDGSVIWEHNVGPPVPGDDLQCSRFDPMGIIGTPVVDLTSRALFLNAITTPDNGVTIKHYIISLNVDTGDINQGWPVDVEMTAHYNGINFTAKFQQQRPALAVVGNILYVGYGSMEDCDPFHGWLVGVPINNPATVTAWAAATSGDSRRGAIWGVGGVASDGTNPNPFVTTANTYNTGGVWDGGEAVIRFQPGPIFSGSTNDYWAPTNWPQLDDSDLDLGGSGPLLVNVPDATPSNLVVALGKDGNAYLLNRANLGGVSVPIDMLHVTNQPLIQAAATYRTNQGTYVACRAGQYELSSFRITGTNPPTMVPGWSVDRSGGLGCSSPFVTSTDVTNNMIVWVVGSEDNGTPGDQRLHGYDGDTGDVVYDGGGANELMAGTHSYSTTGIAARGRIYIGTDNKVYAFRLPGGTPTPTPTPTATPTPPVTPTPTATPTTSPSPSVTPTPTPRVTPRPRPSPHPRPTPPPQSGGPIRIVDQNGQPVANIAPSAASQIFDVTVGQGFAFVPDTLNISAGDTVRWTWASSGHSVTSGTPCTVDGQFCSPDNMNCAAGALSNAGTVYEHTFSSAGDFSYFCAAHCSIGMTGVIHVAPSPRPTVRPRPSLPPRPTPPPR